MPRSAVAPDAASFMRRCLRGWTHDRRAISEQLNERGAWSGVEEWRISTETVERIEARQTGYLLVSSCGVTWRAAMPTLAQALRTRALLFGFHVELFYSLGWPSWAASNRLEPGEPGSEMRHAKASPYLARLSDSAVERKAQLARRVTAEGSAFVARVAVDSLLVESTSPTRERAAQFQGVYEQLVPDALAWLRQ